MVPENLLRLYIEFSAPMNGSGIEHLALLDDAGTPVDGAFLPLDYEFWSPATGAGSRCSSIRAA